MNKTKRGYEAPTSDLLVVRFEQNLLTSGTMSVQNWQDDEDSLDF